MKTTLSIIALALSIASVRAQDEPRKAAPDKTDNTAEKAITIGPVTVITSVSGGSKTESTKQSAYLGVVTGSVTAPVRAQLGLPEGMGLTVEAVAKGGPAEKAGIRQYDVLKKFNDQTLCSPDQLAALVGAAGKDAKVSLVILRNGGEQTVAVTLGEHAVTTPAFKIGGTWSPEGGPQVDIQLDNLVESLKGFGVDAGQIGQQVQNQINKQRKEIEERTQNAAGKTAEAAGRARAMADSQAKIYSFRPGSGSNTQTNVIVKDAESEIRIQDVNGKVTVQIKSLDGKEIYSGPLNADKDYDAIPETFRDKVRNAAKDIKKTGGKAKTKGESV